jgi:hypothetical protein
MIALDYFLYDNRTWSPQWDYDWGIKAATGVLASRVELKGEFRRYCKAMPGDLGNLAGFGEALGGIRARARNGYLLCVTLENRDRIGRPSWTVFGLWCPDAVTLQNVLTGDPIGAAKAVADAATPPAVIHVPTAGVAIRPGRRKSSGTTFHRFAAGTTPREVSSILFGAIRTQTVLPNVLGITATSRLAALVQAGFDRVYCHPMDEGTERALVRRLSPPDVLEDETWPAVVETKPPAASARSTHLQPGSAGGFFWPAVLAASLVAVIFVTLVYDLRLDARLPKATATQTSDSLLTGMATAPSEPEPSPQPEAALDNLKRSLEEFRKLEPEDLRQSRGFRTANEVAVLVKEHGEDRKRVQDAYAKLLELRERMFTRHDPYVAYYFDELNTGPDSPSPAERLEKIARILGEKPLGGEACTTLQTAFGFEFETEDSEVRRWCEASTRLESKLTSLVASGTK